MPITIVDPDSTVHDPAPRHRHIGGMFGPVTIVWFVAIACSGHALHRSSSRTCSRRQSASRCGFFATTVGTVFLVLGTVFLVVTGGEALYADMGHFGAGRCAWPGSARPAGAAAQLLRPGSAAIAGNPKAAENPFYHAGAAGAVLPLVVLATVATVIASQALITGVFSLTRQAVQLGFVPRVRSSIRPRRVGQIYMPKVNWALMLACIALVLYFQKSSALAAAYGIAVTSTMVITTVLAFVVVAQGLGLEPVESGRDYCRVPDHRQAFFGANASRSFTAAGCRW